MRFLSNSLIRSCIIIASSFINRCCSEHRLGLMRPIWSSAPWRVGSWTLLCEHLCFCLLSEGLAEITTNAFWTFWSGARVFLTASHDRDVPHLHIPQVYRQSECPASPHPSGRCTESSAQRSPGKSLYIHHKGPIFFLFFPFIALNLAKATGYLLLH